MLDRFKAFIVDIFMVYVPLLYFFTYVICGSKEEFLNSSLAQFSSWGIYTLVLSLLLSKSGKTMGYRYMNLELSYIKRSFIVNLIFMIIRMLIFYLSMALVVGLCYPFFRKDRRPLHDLLTGTEVIKLKDE